MTTTHLESHTSWQLQGSSQRTHPLSGTEDDDDDRNDEHAGENEALGSAIDEGTETPEEFEMYRRRKSDQSEADVPEGPD